MLSSNSILPETEPTPAEKETILKLYRKPQLTELGDLRTLTLGSSAGGSFDSPTGQLWEWSYP